MVIGKVRSRYTFLLKCFVSYTGTFILEYMRQAKLGKELTELRIPIALCEKLRRQKFVSIMHQ